MRLSKFFHNPGKTFVPRNAACGFLLLILTSHENILYLRSKCITDGASNNSRNFLFGNVGKIPQVNSQKFWVQKNGSCFLLSRTRVYMKNKQTAETLLASLHTQLSQQTYSFLFRFDTSTEIRSYFCLSVSPKELRAKCVKFFSMLCDSAVCIYLYSSEKFRKSTVARAMRRNPQFRLSKPFPQTRSIGRIFNQCICKSDF